MATTSLGRPAAVPAPVDAGPHPSLRVLEYFLVLMRRTFRGTLFGSFFSPLLYLVAMGYGLGSLVDQGGSSAIDGVPYVQFIAPGVLVATAMQTGVFDASYPVLGSIKWGRQFHAMLATPVGRLGHRGRQPGRRSCCARCSAPWCSWSWPLLLGAIPSWTGVFALVAVVLVTLAVRRSDVRHLARTPRPTPRSTSCSGSAWCRCSCSPARSSRSSSCRAGCSPSPT